MTVLSLWKGQIPPPASMNRRERMEAALADVAAEYDVAADDILGPTKRPKVCAARQAAMHRLYALGWLSTSQVGRFLNRDHSTVVYGLKAHKARMSERLEAEAA